MSPKCRKCRSENPDDTRFCHQCGSDLLSDQGPSIKSLSAIPGHPVELDIGSIFAGRYRIVEELGKGGMGKVYKAFDTEIKDTVALKLLRRDIGTEPETVERFQNEIKIARRISHKNVCRLYHFGIEEGIIYITMEFVTGEDLRSVLKMARRLNPDAAVKLVMQVCEGLGEAHRIGVVHRDLKSSNIMIDQGADVRILDFGLARSLHMKGITGKGIILGTPEYVSPEQASAEVVDQRSDIYSLGVILYEMVTGHVPFEGETPLSTVLKHRTERPIDPRQQNLQVPEALSRVILKCLEKDPADRFQTVDELFQELGRLEAGMAPESQEVLPGKSRDKSARSVRIPLKWLILASAAALALIIRFGIFKDTSPPAVQPAGEKIMLVVLPFENLGLPEDDYFAEGLTEEITNRLAALRGLGVISRTSAAQYRDTNKNIPQIGSELGVDFVLEGSVRWDRNSGDQGRVRVMAQLIRVADDTHLWAERYDSPLEDIFTVQSEIAEQVIMKLDLTVLEPERRAVLARPTNNFDAYRRYLRAAEHLKRGYNNRDQQEFEAAMKLLNEAVRIDPRFTYAYLALSSAHHLLYSLGIDRTDVRLTLFREAVDQAMALEPDLPDAQLALASYYLLSSADLTRPLEIYDAVQKARPNILIPRLGFLYRRMGKGQEAIAYFQKAFQLDPLDATTPHALARTYAWLGSYEAAGQWFDRALAIDPELYYSQLGKARLPLLAEGDTESSRSLMERLPPHNLTDYNLFLLGMIERDFSGILELLEASPYEAFGEAHFYIPKNLAYAMVYAAQGQRDFMAYHAEAARIALEKALAANTGDARLHAALGMTIAYLGRSDDAVREGMRAMELYPLSADAFEAPRYLLNMARIHTLTGDRDTALDLLERLLSLPSGNVVSPPLVRLDPFWEPLRGMPRFRQMLQTR